MDAGLLSAGVSSVARPPGAPPGKEIETPPAEAKNEFRDVLKQAEGKSSGEVAEAEPNAQPQKLDSTEDPIKTKFELPQNWAGLIGFAVVSSQLAVPADAMALVEVSAPLNLSLDSQIAKPALEVVQGSSSSELLKPEIVSELNVVEVSTKQILTAPKVRDFDIDLDANPQPQGIPVRAKNGGEVLPQTVKVPSTQIESQLAEQVATSPNAGLVKAIGLNSNEPTLSGANSSDSADTSTFTDSFAIAAQPENGLEESTDNESGSSFNGQGQPGQPELKAISSEPSEKVEQSMSLTQTERRAVVHQLTQKIEALAVNSVRNEVTIRMQPAELGTVLVQVSRGLSGLTASLSASDERLQSTLHETKNELAAALSSKANTTVRVEITSAEATLMGTFSDSNRHSSHQPQPRQEALTKFFQPKTSEAALPPTRNTRVSTGLIDLES